MEFRKDTLKFLTRLGNDLFFFLCVYILRYLISGITLRDMEQMRISLVFFF